MILSLSYIDCQGVDLHSGDNAYEPSIPQGNFYRILDMVCRDPLPSPSLILTSLGVYEWLTSLTGGVHDDG